MTGFFLELMRNTYTAPRVAARRVMETVKTPQEVALLFALSASIGSIMMVISAMGEEAPAGLFGLLIANLILSAAGFAILVGLIYGIGRLFGGKGSFFSVAAVLVWHSIATVIFAPFISPAAMTGALSPIFALQVAIVAVVTWLLVNFIAEVHGFKSAWRVAGVLLGAILLVGLLMPLLFAGMVPAA